MWSVEIFFPNSFPGSSPEPSTLPPAWQEDERPWEQGLFFLQWSTILSLCLPRTDSPIFKKWLDFWKRKIKLIIPPYMSLVSRGFIKFLCRRSVGFFSQEFLVFLMKESKKRRRKQPGKLMAESCLKPVNLPGAQPLMNPLCKAWIFSS